MVNFLKTVLACFISLIIFTAFGLLLIVGIATVASSDKETEIKANSILHLKLNKPFVELASDDPFSDFEPFGGSGNLGLINVLDAIRQAKDDENIEGIYLEPRMMGAGFATLQELRDALIDFKSDGKFIVAYSEYYSEGGYYLASVADSIYMNPIGEVEFNGLSAQLSFFKGTLEKIGLEPQVFRVGDFKSAVEPFIREDASEENKLQTSSFLNDIHETYIANVSRSLDQDPARLKEVSDKMLVRAMGDAEQYNLIHKRVYQDEVYNTLMRLVDVEEEKDLKLVPYNDYKSTVKNRKTSRNRIAVIVAEGGIVSGEGDNNSIGSDKFAKVIREARMDDKVKAIVMRVNSPGGSALASEVIWRELKLAAEQKPVIASMGDYAASGGYYIAAACDSIVAQPNTITGSIGIFGILFNSEELLTDKMGITFDVVKTGELSDMLTMSRALTDQEKSIFQNAVNEGYEVFIDRVVQGRDKSEAEIKAIASGRVWTGSQGLENGLVDQEGGIYDAIAMAAAAADLGDDYRVNYLPKPKTFFETIFKGFSTEMEESVAKAKLGDLYPIYQKVEKLKQQQGIQAVLPFQLELK